MICEDCQERGHANKRYYKYKFYKEASVDDASSGTKRRQNSSLKQAKQQAKRQKEGTNSTVICKSCQQSGHSTSRSRLCPNHNLAKNEVLARNLGFPYIAFTRKLPLDSIVKSDYKEIPKNKIIVSSRDTRNIVSRVMLLTNSYSLSKPHDSIPHAVLTQRYWYSVCQLINGKKIRNNGASQCLTKACKELETCYNNHIVENFEQRLLYFFKNRKLESILFSYIERTSE
ncbi:hypothetical protein BCV72DRAFT_285998 [Rhizopus microsporus var. microsporus]|uniref:Uncharacterized protein n=1 Tax=Rhizopus microsporus var. microsporus TaxID=86635 RepID=A0A1X0RE97_RHIZD|nr:hypothetical protein BCV72DRAFT_285998 [Rhizopus microsporus var. microsporus]